MIQSKYIFSLIMLIFMTLPITEFSAQSYDEAPIKEGTFSKENWKNTIADLEYSESSASKKKRKENEALEKGRRGEAQESYEPGWAERTMFQGNNAIKVIFFSIAILALAFVIWKIVQAQMKLKNPKIGKQVDFIKDVVEDIHETDLEHFLREALASDNYKMAIRVYYLMIIKELANKKLILWKKDKTNNIYVREMQTTEYYQNFREITRNFERAWFGEKEVEKADFQKLQPQFKGFVSSIK
jgi:hypothetical protein